MQQDITRAEWRRIHNRAAPAYRRGAWARETLFGVARLRRELFAQATGQVLDVGCGYGANFAYLPNAAHITGLDFSINRSKAQTGGTLIMRTITTTGATAAQPHPTRAVRRVLRRATRIGLGLLIVLIALSAIGATYQAVASARDARAYPPPGQLVDIGGYRLHINCTGPETGGPTLILDHGGGAFGASDFTTLQPQLATFARVCSYDRAGYGWSDPSPRPRTVDHETDELRTLLERAGIAGPYVLVADSLGAYTLRTYATRYPDKVVGMVLIDTSTEGEWMIPEIRAFNQQFGIVTAFCRASAPIGLWRLLGETGLFPYPVLAYAPPDQRARLQAQTYRSAYCSTIYQETGLWNLDASAAMLHATRRSLGDLPLIILTAGSGYPSEGYRQGWLAEQADLRSLSARSEQRIIAEASHYNLTTDRADVVVDAVRDVLAMIATPR